MNKYFRDITLKATKASELYEIETIQSLWSGYGNILRYGLESSNIDSVVIKHVRLAEKDGHPRGWNTNLSHERKLKSYKVETAWYDQWSKRCDNSCRIPKCMALETLNDEVLMVLEDLDTVGFGARKTSVSWNEIGACLKWLANFHATFLGEKPTNLWNIGTYWHLDTRPDELEEMSNSDLKEFAQEIDRKLNNNQYQTFVHGDAKLANFCFSEDGKKVAAVDFQYVGGGCGMKDVAYFVSSCLYEDDCERMEADILNFYFKELRIAIETRKKDIDINLLEKDWRAMYPIAWTDFHRFLKGWSPDHWKINSYSERISREVIKELKSNQ